MGVREAENKGYFAPHMGHAIAPKLQVQGQSICSDNDRDPGSELNCPIYTAAIADGIDVVVVQQKRRDKR
jgi:hypothetical protein